VADERLYLGSTRNFFRTAHGPGWVLLGDAHYKKDPCTAQGITDAFCDAERLAAAIDHGLAGRRPLSEALAEYARQSVEWALPFYELTCQMATFAPPPPDMRALYTALQGNQEAIDRFIGLITEATSPADFFAPEHVQRLLTRPTAQAHCDAASGNQGSDAHAHIS
jgi:2-polyprenyl-6-methoxyphenol hydroxylase-like FAD-dependent oxidoreductase